MIWFPSLWDALGVIGFVMAGLAFVNMHPKKDAVTLGEAFMFGFAAVGLGGPFGPITFVWGLILGAIAMAEAGSGPFARVIWRRKK